MEPTMGRIVYFTPNAPDDVTAVEAPAIVSRVNTDGTLDLTVFPPDKAPYTVGEVSQSQSGKSELGCWCWPAAAPTGSQPEAPAEEEDKPEETPVDPTPPAGEGDTSSTSDGSGGEQSGGTTGDTPTTSAASEKPLYTITGEEVPAGFVASGLEKPDGGDTLFHYEGDTAGQPHTFDVGSVDGIELYAESDDNEQPVQAAGDAASA